MMEQPKRHNDGFHMRELTHADLEQFNALLRYAFQVTSDELTRSGWQEDEFNHAKAPILDGAYVLGWFHKDRLASQIVVYPMQVNIEGVLYDMGGVKAMRALCCRGHAKGAATAMNAEVSVGSARAATRVLLPTEESEVVEVPLKNEGRTFSLRIANEAGGRFTLRGGIELSFETWRRVE